MVQKCREGDRDAQRAIYAQTSDRVYRLLLRMTGNPDDAFDVAQETYLKVFANIHRFEGSSGLTTWIYAIALNEARQFLRRNKRRTNSLRLTSAMPDHADETQENTVAAIDIREALAQLPDLEHSLIVLRHFDHLSYAEMARILGKPEGTIASSLNRARRQLRNLLEGNSGHRREDSAAVRHLNEGPCAEEPSALDLGIRDVEQ